MSRRVSFLNIGECDGITGTAVVIDVLRAFTTAAWALHLGVARIVLTDSIEEASALKAGDPGSLALKDREPLPGFDLDNSPVHLQSRTDLAGRAIIQRTTAGTVGAVAARSAARLYCASFVCAAATAELIRAEGEEHVSFVVTGAGGEAEEDRACAEYIAALLEERSTPAGAYLQRAAKSAAAEKLRADAAQGVAGVAAGDVDACLEVNRFDFAMQASEEHGLLVLRAVSGNLLERAP